MRRVRQAKSESEEEDERNISVTALLLGAQEISVAGAVAHGAQRLLFLMSSYCHSTRWLGRPSFRSKEARNRFKCCWLHVLHNPCEQKRLFIILPLQQTCCSVVVNTTVRQFRTPAPVLAVSAKSTINAGFRTFAEGASLLRDVPAEQNRVKRYKRCGASYRAKEKASENAKPVTGEPYRRFSVGW